MCAAHARSSGTRRPVVTVARVYAAGEGSGYRVLVDRLWPRGVSKDRLRLDEWAKDAAPSTRRSVAGTGTNRASSTSLLVGTTSSSPAHRRPMSWRVWRQSLTTAMSCC